MVQKIVKITEEIWRGLFTLKIKTNEKSLNDVIKKLLEKEMN